MRGVINQSVKVFLASDGLYYGVQRFGTILLPLFMAAKISNYNISIVGYIFSYYMVVHSILALLTSRLFTGTSVNIKIIIVNICLAVIGILSAFLGFATEIWHIILLQTFIALFDSIYIPIKWSLFTKILDHGNEEVEWGLEDVFSGLAIAGVSGLGGYFANVFGYEFVFILIGIIYVFSGLLFYMISFSKTSVQVLD